MFCEIKRRYIDHFCMLTLERSECSIGQWGLKLSTTDENKSSKYFSGKICQQVIFSSFRSWCVTLWKFLELKGRKIWFLLKEWFSKSWSSPSYTCINQERNKWHNSKNAKWKFSQSLNVVNKSFSPRKYVSIWIHHLDFQLSWSTIETK